MYEFKGTGRIVYDPLRGTMKSNTEFWVTIEVDSEITRYYRWWINKFEVNPLGFKDRDILTPSWGSHISVVRGERPKPHLTHLWKKYDNRLVGFEYSNFVKHDKGFWYVSVKCDAAKNIRDELELKSHWPFHITIGKDRVS